MRVSATEERKAKQVSAVSASPARRRERACKRGTGRLLVLGRPRSELARKVLNLAAKIASLGLGLATVSPLLLELRLQLGGLGLGLLGLLAVAWNASLVLSVDMIAAGVGECTGNENA